ncbi:hypothetical protein OEZ85_010984 [Tetradesmus obliquus]|uniref:Deoxynucleoside kinase domain-containing protein n=1 Tax=Tetradesmus obliquus TaxID=3088 RepID=A0ABY8TSS6_TETOB|nr:hypothetical protein OEZ85_010984 [Tetradesmus obliquus]
MMRISIEGNIASSKSSLLQLLHEKGGYAVFPEPVHEWGEWLQLFYQDTKRWAFGFQMKVLSSFVRDYGASTAQSIVERSMLSVRHVFGQLLFNQNLLAQKEWDLFRAVADMFTWEPNAIIYIACPPEVCLERMRARARPAEAHVTLEYLHKIDFMYTHMLKYFSGKRYSPVEDVEDDYTTEDYNSSGEEDSSDLSSEDFSLSSEEEEDTEGEVTPTLEQFIVEDDGDDDDDINTRACGGDSDREWVPPPSAAAVDDDDDDDDDSSELIATEDFTESDDDEGEEEEE